MDSWLNAEAGNLLDEVSREETTIMKLEVAQDTAYWDLKEKLTQLEGNHERLQQNMDVDIQHETISGNTLSPCKTDQETLCEANLNLPSQPNMELLHLLNPPTQSSEKESRQLECQLFTAQRQRDENFMTTYDITRELDVIKRELDVMKCELDIMNRHLDYSNAVACDMAALREAKEALEKELREKNLANKGRANQRADIYHRQVDERNPDGDGDAAQAPRGLVQQQGGARECDGASAREREQDGCQSGAFGGYC